MTVGIFSGRRILFLHFRAGRTDGVSIEMGAWKEILERAGARITLAAGKFSLGADRQVDHLEHQLDQSVFDLNTAAFDRFRPMGETEWTKVFIRHQQELQTEFERLLAETRPDMLVVSNIFSVGENLPAAGALVRALDRFRVPTMAVCHDFYWENEFYRHPAGEVVSRQLADYYPPRRDYMAYACINSLAREQLMARKRIAARLLPDTLDFDRVIQRDPIYRKQLQEAGVNGDDIVVLQATRIVRRKNIELAIDLVRELEMILAGIGKVKLYDGREFESGRGRVALVCSGYAEERDKDYYRHLQNYGRSAGIKIVWLNGQAANGETGLVPILKLHQWADLVTYPSEYEGFGNQFLEAIYSRKPVTGFEYPVFKADIAPKGFEIISLGDRYDSGTDGLVKVPAQVLREAAERSVEVLTDPEKYGSITEKNFLLGRKYFGYEPALRVFEETSGELDMSTRPSWPNPG